MSYRPGDCVYPADLPRRFLCRVAAVQSFPAAGGTFQILNLEPLEGPWRAGTRLVRDDSAVRPARAGVVRRHLASRRDGRDRRGGPAPEHGAAA